MLLKAGIDCCPTAISGTNSLKTGLFYLKRYMTGFNFNDAPLDNFK